MDDNHPSDRKRKFSATHHVALHQLPLKKPTLSSHTTTTATTTMDESSVDFLDYLNFAGASTSDATKDESTTESFLLSPILKTHHMGKEVGCKVGMLSPEQVSEKLVQKRCKSAARNQRRQDTFVSLTPVKNGKDEGFTDKKQNTVGAWQQLDTSYCPSLGLGSLSSGDGEEEEEESILENEERNYVETSATSDIDENDNTLGLVSLSSAETSKIGLEKDDENIKKTNEDENIKKTNEDVNIKRTNEDENDEDEYNNVSDHLNHYTPTGSSELQSNREGWENKESSQAEKKENKSAGRVVWKDLESEAPSSVKTTKLKTSPNYALLIDKLTPTRSAKKTKSLGLGLTPKLQKLRSRLSNVAGQVYTPEEVKDSLILKERTPSDTTSLNNEISTSEPSSSRKVSGLSLTPALKLFRSRLYSEPLPEDDFQIGLNIDHVTTSSTLQQDKQVPFESFDSSDNSHAIESFLSPTMEKEKRNLILEGDTLFSPQDGESNGRESYLSQYNDLSSAKKKFDARSTTKLVERLRGVAQKKINELTRSRDTVVETLQLRELEDSGKITAPKDTIDVDINGNPLQERKVPKRSSFYKPFKARPIPTTTRQSCGQVGVPKVTKRPITKAISPKLGKLRKSHKKETRKKINEGRGVIKVESPKDDLVGIDFLNKTPSEKENVSPTLSLKEASGEKNPVKATPNNKENKPPTYSMKTPSNRQSSFTLHSEIRAKERAKFDSTRRKNEQERKETFAKERALSIKKKQKELERLRMLLR